MTTPHPTNAMVVELNDCSSLHDLFRTVTESDSAKAEYKQPIAEAIDVLARYEQERNLSPAQIVRVYAAMQLKETDSPREMYDHLYTHENIAVLEKKFLDTYLSRSKFQTTVLQLVAQFNNLVPVTVINAIVTIVKNLSYLCVTIEEFNILYKDLCFKFFTVDSNTDDVLVLVLNIHYGDLQSMFGCSNFFSRIRRRMHLSFFGALVKTDVLRAGAST